MGESLTYLTWILKANDNPIYLKDLGILSLHKNQQIDLFILYLVLFPYVVLQEEKCLAQGIWF